MDQFAHVLPPNGVVITDDLVVEIPEWLEDEPLLVLELKIKSKGNMRMDELWAFLQIRDEVFPDVLGPEYLSNDRDDDGDDGDDETEPEPELKPSLSIWRISDLVPSQIELRFRMNGNLELVRVPDPSPWVSPSAGILRSPDSDDIIYLRILYKHPARRDQRPWPRPEEGDLVVEYQVQLRPTKKIISLRVVDDAEVDMPIEGIPIVVLSNPLPQPQVSRHRHTFNSTAKYSLANQNASHKRKRNPRSSQLFERHDRYFQIFLQNQCRHV